MEGEDAMSQVRNEYRGHAFMVEALLEDGLWRGRFHMLAHEDKIVHAAANEAGLYRWVSMDDGWATRNEAENYATEAAHAVIDRLPHPMANHDS